MARQLLVFFKMIEKKFVVYIHGILQTHFKPNWYTYTDIPQFVIRTSKSKAFNRIMCIWHVRRMTSCLSVICQPWTQNSKRDEKTFPKIFKQFHSHSDLTFAWEHFGWPLSTLDNMTITYYSSFYTEELRTKICIKIQNTANILKVSNEHGLIERKELDKHLLSIWIFCSCCFTS